MRPALLSAVLLLTACPPPPAATVVPGAYNGPSDAEVVVTVNGNAITADLVDVALSRVPADQLEQMRASGQYQQILTKMATGDALWREALTRKIHERPEVQMKLAMSARDTLAQALLEDVAAEALTEEKIQAAYDARAVRYAKPSADVSMILLQDGAKAAELRAQLDGGADFATLAKTESLDPTTGEKGGSFGWVGKGELNATLDELIFGETTPDTGLVGPVEASGLFVLLNIAGRRTATPLDEVREELVQELEGEEVQAWIDTFEKNLTLAFPGDAAPAAEAAPEAAPAEPAAEH